jgi:hypothetical protein
MRVLQVWSTVLKKVRMSCRPCLESEAESSDEIDSLRLGDRSMVNFWGPRLGWMLRLSCGFLCGGRWH